MILDHSVFFGMGDMHDRHRDMRLDVDNMSYEVRAPQSFLHLDSEHFIFCQNRDFRFKFQELLALEERIGNVSTGLNEETIMARLKQHKYAERRADQAETEPCSICRVLTFCSILNVSSCNTYLSLIQKFGMYETTALFDAGGV